MKGTKSKQNNKHKGPFLGIDLKTIIDDNKPKSDNINPKSKTNPPKETKTAQNKAQHIANKKEKPLKTYTIENRPNPQPTKHNSSSILHSIKLNSTTPSKFHNSSSIKAIDNFTESPIPKYQTKPTQPSGISTDLLEDDLDHLEEEEEEEEEDVSENNDKNGITENTQFMSQVQFEEDRKDPNWDYLDLIMQKIRLRNRSAKRNSTLSTINMNNSTQFSNPEQSNSNQIKNELNDSIPNEQPNINQPLDNSQTTNESPQPIQKVSPNSVQNESHQNESLNSKSPQNENESFNHNFPQNQSFNQDPNFISNNSLNPNNEVNEEQVSTVLRENLIDPEIRHRDTPFQWFIKNSHYYDNEDHYKSKIDESDNQIPPNMETQDFLIFECDTNIKKTPKTKSPKKKQKLTWIVDKDKLPDPRRSDIDDTFRNPIRREPSSFNRYDYNDTENSKRRYIAYPSPTRTSLLRQSPGENMRIISRIRSENKRIENKSKPRKLYQSDNQQEDYSVTMYYPKNTLDTKLLDDFLNNHQDVDNFVDNGSPKIPPNNSDKNDAFRIKFPIMNNHNEQVDNS